MTDEEKVPATFGERVRQVREKQGISTGKLAELVSDGRIVTSERIESIESGETPIGDLSIHSVRRLANALSASIDYLLSGAMEVPPEGAVSVFICSRGRKASSPCHYCSEPHTCLCDGPGAKPGTTCSRRLCRNHARRVGKDKDFCATHAPNIVTPNMPVPPGRKR
jgi:hypothetical protein